MTVKIQHIVTAEVSHQISGLRISEVERSVVACLVYLQATRSLGWIMEAQPPSASKSAVAKLFDAAEFKYALLCLAAVGLVAEHPDQDDAIYLTEAGVEYACATRLARWCDRHLIGESAGLMFLIDPHPDITSGDAAVRERINERINAAMARMAREIETAFLGWGRLNWVAPDFLSG